MEGETTHMLSDRLVEQLDAQTVNELRSLERIALGRSIKVESNGRFPHWTPERWMTVSIFVSTIIAWLWFAGGEWSRVKNKIEYATTTIEATAADVKEVRAWQAEGQKKIDALKLQIETIEKSDEYYRTHPRPRPTFPEDAR